MPGATMPSTTPGSWRNIAAMIPSTTSACRRDLRLLPSTGREAGALRQLDRAFREEDSATQRRLWEVLDRFSAWLDRLPDDDRRRVEEAPNREARLRVIKELREQEFVRHLPKKVRETLDQIPQEKRTDEIARFAKRSARCGWRGTRKGGRVQVRRRGRIDRPGRAI